MLTEVFFRARRLLMLTACLFLGTLSLAHARDSLAKYAGVYRGETRTKEETREQSRESAYALRHHTIALTLGADGTATLTESPDAVSETTRFAYWTYAAEQIQLRFDPLPDGSTPSAESFRIEHHTLVPVQWDHKLWKTLPPPKLQRE